MGRLLGVPRHTTTLAERKWNLTGLTCGSVRCYYKWLLHPGRGLIIIDFKRTDLLNGDGPLIDVALA